VKGATMNPKHQAYPLIMLMAANTMYNMENTIVLKFHLTHHFKKSKLIFCLHSIALKDTANLASSGSSYPLENWILTALWTTLLILRRARE